MERTLIYILLFALAGGLIACGAKRKRINPRVSLWRNDKNPYGTWYAYEQLQHVFPNAKVVVNKKSPDRYKNFSLQDFGRREFDTSVVTKSCYFIVARQVMPDNAELDAILQEVWSGNHVFISATQFSDNLIDSMRVHIVSSGNYYLIDSMKLSLVNPVINDTVGYAYPGLDLQTYFSQLDTNITSILGYDESGRANFIRISYEGGGSIFLHLAPGAFTNFFLLHKNNKEYYDEALSYIPKSVDQVRWDDYFRNNIGGNSKSGGRLFGWLFNQQAFLWALLLTLALFLLIYLFETKRKQRLIETIQPLRNASLDFVKTIGRLYYHRKDNSNLVSKMSAHFFDHVRNRYNIPTSKQNEEFERRLAYKSGYDPEELHNLLYKMKMLDAQPDVTDEELLDFNRQLEKFYKH